MRGAERGRLRGHGGDGEGCGKGWERLERKAEQGAAGGRGGEGAGGAVWAEGRAGFVRGKRRPLAGRGARLDDDVLRLGAAQRGVGLGVELRSRAPVPGWGV